MTTETRTYTFDVDTYSDLYKDVYGVRPHYSRFYADDTTDDERQAMWDSLLVEHDRAMDEYAADEKRADESFERQIAQNLSYGAPDRATAIRWMLESYEIDENDRIHGFGYFQYQTGVSYKYQDEVNAVLLKAA